MAVLLKGKPVADALMANACKRSAQLFAQGVVPALAVVRVGENAGDLAYERTIVKWAERAGAHVAVKALPATVSQAELERAIREVNANDAVHGCLLFRPLPPILDEAAACELIDPAKDVDGVTRASLAGVFMGESRGFSPSTAEACIHMLDYYDVSLDGARVVVVGRSMVVGKPLAMLLLERNATVTVCHSHTAALDEVCREGDIVICATGQAEAFDARYFREGQTVLDVGINFTPEGSMCGDVHALSVEPVVAALTPVPGGVGSVTTAVTFDHVVTAAERMS